MNAAALQALLRPLTHRIRAIAARVTVKRVNDTAGLQSAQLTALAGEVLEAVQRLQQFGFTANPPVGSTGLIVCLGGSRSAPVLLGVEHPASRLKNLESGESAIYNAFGDFAKFKKDGTLEVVASKEVTVTSPLVTVNAATKVTLQTPLVECTENLLVTGALTALGAVTFGAGGAPVTATLNGTLSATGDLSDANGTMQEMRDLYNGHGHPPGGVTPQMT